MDEGMEILRGLCSGEYFGYSGEIYNFEPIKICPVPTKPLPLLVGGHSKAALRRAVVHGDGWMHAGGDPDELSRMLTRINELRSEHGKQNDPFEVHVISIDAYSPDGIRRLEDLGVTDAIVGFRDSYAFAQDTETLEEKIGHLETYAEDVIARCR